MLTKAVTYMAPVYYIDTILMMYLLPTSTLFWSGTVKPYLLPLKLKVEIQLIESQVTCDSRSFKELYCWNKSDWFFFFLDLIMQVIIWSSHKDLHSSLYISNVLLYVGVGDVVDGVVTMETGNEAISIFQIIFFKCNHNM